MKRKKILSNPELAALILDVINKLKDETGFTPPWISLGDPAFYDVPCSRDRLYRVARAYCESWGYKYQPVTYRASRAHYHQPFDRVPDDLKAKFTKPALIKVKS